MKDIARQLPRRIGDMGTFELLFVGWLDQEQREFVLGRVAKVRLMHVIAHLLFYSEHNQLFQKWGIEVSRRRLAHLYDFAQLQLAAPRVGEVDSDSRVAPLRHGSGEIVLENGGDAEQVHPKPGRAHVVLDLQAVVVRSTDDGAHCLLQNGTNLWSRAEEVLMWTNPRRLHAPGHVPLAAASGQRELGRRVSVVAAVEKG